MNKEILNKKFESVKVKVKDTKIIDELKKHIKEFIDSNNKEVDEIKNNHKKDIINKKNKRRIK